MTASWKAGDWAMVRVTDIGPGDAAVQFHGGWWRIPFDALHPLPPAMSAEDAEIVEHDLRDARINLLALVSDPHNPDWTLATTNGNSADAECLDRALASINRGLDHLRAAVRSRAAPQIPQDSGWQPDDLHADGADREAEVVGLRDAVVEAARVQNASLHEDGGGSIAFLGTAIATCIAIDALDTALAPPEPVDAVAELREAAAKSVRILERAELNLRSVSQDNGAGTAVCEALSELREALARAP